MKRLIQRMMQHLRGKRGAAMSAIVLTTAVVGGAVVVAGIATAALQWSAGARNLADQARATAIAEAGIADAYVLLSEDFNRATDPDAFDPVAFGGGTYHNRVVLTNDLVMIASDGTFRNTRATAAVALRLGSDPTAGAGATPPPPPIGDTVPVLPGPGPSSPYGYAVLAGGIINWGGTAGVNAPGAWVHANQKLELYGNGDMTADVSSSDKVAIQGNANKQYVDGSAYAPAIDSGRSIHFSGDKNIVAVNDLQIPQINFAPYAAWAQVNNEYRNGDTHISTDYEPVGGVLFVNGNLHLNGGNLRGCFAATGDIHVNAQVRHSAIPGLPGLMSDTGSVKLNGGAQLEGLIYARIGNADKFNGNAQVRGSIIIGGFMEVNGTFDFIYVDSTPAPPWVNAGALPPPPAGGGTGSAGATPPAPATLYLVGWQD